MTKWISVFLCLSILLYNSPAFSQPTTSDPTPQMSVIPDSLPSPQITSSEEGRVWTYERGTASNGETLIWRITPSRDDGALYNISYLIRKSGTDASHIEKHYYSWLGAASNKLQQLVFFEKIKICYTQAGVLTLRNKINDHYSYDRIFINLAKDNEFVVAPTSLSDETDETPFDITTYLNRVSHSCGAGFISFAPE